jgi:hypothetical protein
VDNLFFILSPNHKPKMKEFKYDNIQLIDKSNTAYLKWVDPYLSEVDSLIRKYNPKTVCFIGSSKGGFAAIMTSVEMTKRFEKIQVRALAINPLTVLYHRQKFDEGLGPAIKVWIDNANSDYSIERYGDLNKLLRYDYLTTRLQVKCIYSGNDKWIKDIGMTYMIQDHDNVSSIRIPFEDIGGVPSTHVSCSRYMWENRDYYYEILDDLMK